MNPARARSILLRSTPLRPSLALLMFLILPSIAPAQDTLWTRTYGGDDEDIGNAVLQTDDGGFITVGNSRSFGSGITDIYVVKTDPSGDTLWTRLYGGRSWDEGESIRQTPDGGYIIAGETQSQGAGRRDVYLIRTDGSGDTLWTRSYGGPDTDQAQDIESTMDGGFIVTGWTGSLNQGYRQLLLMKTDAFGDSLWTRYYGGENAEYGYSVLQTPDGGYAVAGFTASTDGDRGDVLLLKTDASGSMQWKKTYGGPYSDTGYSVQTTADGGFIVAGELGVTNRDNNVYLIRTDAAGDTLWTKNYGTSNADRGKAVRCTPEGDFIVTGYTSSWGADGWDVLLLKADPSGNLLWARTYGGEGTDSGNAIDITDDGGYILAGQVSTGDYHANDLYLIRVAETTAGIDEEGVAPAGVPRAFSLFPNHPNPFNPSTTIAFEVPGGEAAPAGRVVLAVFDLRGRRVRTLVEADFEPGRYTVGWNGRDDRGARVPSGLYLYTLRTGGQSLTRKMTILK